MTEGGGEGGGGQGENAATLDTTLALQESQSPHIHLDSFIGGAAREGPRFIEVPIAHTVIWNSNIECLRFYST